MTDWLNHPIALQLNAGIPLTDAQRQQLAVPGSGIQLYRVELLPIDEEMGDRYAADVFLSPGQRNPYQRTRIVRVPDSTLWSQYVAYVQNIEAGGDITGFLGTRELPSMVTLTQTFILAVAAVGAGVALVGAEAGAAAAAGGAEAGAAVETAATVTEVAEGAATVSDLVAAPLVETQVGVTELAAETAVDAQLASSAAALPDLAAVPASLVPAEELVIAVPELGAADLAAIEASAAEAVTVTAPTFADVVVGSPVSSGIVEVAEIAVPELPAADLAAIEASAAEAVTVAAPSVADVAVGAPELPTGIVEVPEIAVPELGAADLGAIQAAASPGLLPTWATSTGIARAVQAAEQKIRSLLAKPGPGDQRAQQYAAGELEADAQGTGAVIPVVLLLAVLAAVIR